MIDWTPMGPPEGNILEISTIFQNRLNTIKNMNFNVNFKKSVPGVTPSRLPPEIKF